MFLGWYADDEEGTPRVKNGDVVTDALTRKLYAHWKERTAPVAITGFSFASKAARATRRGTTTDSLDRAFTGIASGATYGTWSGKTGDSGAVYAGQSAGGNNAIQLRSDNSNSGIVTTKSGGKAKKVTVTWHSQTSDGRTLNVYGKNSAYSQATDLYGNNAGTLIGTIVAGTSTELSITGDYEYIGMRSASKAMYLSEVKIEWATSSDTPTVTVQATATEIEEGESVTVTASASGFSDNDSVQWAWFLGETQQAETSATLSLNNLAEGTYQVTAWGYLGDDLATATEKDDDIVTITVNPASVYYTITVDDQIENGSIEADKASAQDGETVTLTAHPDDGYALDKFYVDGTEIPGNTFQIQGADVTVSATFKVKTSYTAIYTVTSKTAVSATGDVPAGSSATYSQTYGTVSQATKGNSFSLTLKGYEGLKIVGLTLSMHSNASGGAGTLSVTSGTDTIASIANAGFGDDSWHGSYINSYVDVTPAVTQTVVDDDVIFLITASTNSLFCQSYSVEYEFVPAEPSVTLSPSGDLEVYVNDVVTVTATPHDFSGDVDWTWYVNNAPVAGATTATFTLDTSVADSYAVTAMANYGNDEMAESDPLNVTVKTPSTPHAIEIETDDNGTVTADPNPAMEGVTVTLTAVPNEGYRLDYVESDEVTITDMQFVMPNQNVGVYAYFEGKHDVVIDDQIVNGSVVASPATAFSDETVTLTVQADEGYKLDTLTVLDEDANEIPVTDMSFVMPKGDAYVFATFVELADLYFQFETSESWGSYDDATPAFVNTGSTAEDIPSVTFNTSRTLRGNGPNDRKVGGYAMRMAPTSAKDAVVANAAAFAQDISKVAFQYAKYGTDSFESFTVQVSADGNTWSDLATQPATPTTSLQTYVNEDVPEGMKFIRFVTTNSGSSNERFNIDEIQIWFADVPMQTFRYDVNDGGTGEASCEVLELAMPIGSIYDGAVQAVWANHWFNGWWTDPTDGAGTRYQNTISVVPDNGGEAIQLYAHWAIAQVVTLYANGGTCDKPSVTRPVGDVYWGLPSSPTRDGYMFMGWYADDEDGARVKNGDVVTDALTRKLYAHWSALQVVTLEANGGTCDKPSVTRPVGDVYWGLPSSPTLDGHVFLGWYADDEEGTPRVKNGDVVTDALTRKLYAHWKERTAPVAITGFSFASRAAAPAARSADNATVECTLWVTTIATLDYEVLWTDDLTGEWTVLKRWTAEADGSTPVKVEVPADAATGFFGILELGAE